jgi:hypothetical protein
MNPMKKQDDLPTELPEGKFQLQLQRYSKIGQQNVGRTDGAHRWAAAHNLEDLSLFERYGILWSAGDLSVKLPSDPAVRKEFIQSGLLDANGNEALAGRAAFSVFDADGRYQNLWAIAEDGSSKFLPGRPVGVWNLSVSKHSRHLYVVADPVAALMMITARYVSVLAVEPHAGVVALDVLKSRGVQRITVVAGDTAAATTEARLLIAKFTGIPTDVAILLGCAGVKEYFRQHGAKALATAVTAAAAGLKDAEIPNFLPTADGFRIRFDTREYTGKGLTKVGLQMKLTLLVQCRGKIHVDTLDIYQSRARKEFVREAARLLEEPPKHIEEDMARLISACEKRATQPDLAPPDQPIESVPEGMRKEAELFGQSPDLFARIREHLTMLGIVGEETNKMIVYLGMTSRLLPQPLAIMMRGAFATGKSMIMDGVSELCPTESIYPASYLSGKALVHMAVDALKKKFMPLAESKGVEDSDYFLRLLISAGHLVARITSRDPASGRLFTETKRIEGPTAVMVTTAKAYADEETSSRFILLGADESRAQTRRILQSQRERHGLAGLLHNAETEKIRSLHHAFQRLLQSYAVVIPEGLELPSCDDRMSARRDWPKIANLVKAVALLRQMQKTVKQEAGINYIEVDAEDVKIATPLIEAVFKTPMRELTVTSRNLLQSIHDLRLASRGQAIESNEVFTFTMRQLREYAGLPETTMHRCKVELERYGLLVREAASRRRPYRYWLDWSPDVAPPQAAA